MGEHSANARPSPLLLLTVAYAAGCAAGISSVTRAAVACVCGAEAALAVGGFLSFLATTLLLAQWGRRRKWRSAICSSLILASFSLCGLARGEIIWREIRTGRVILQAHEGEGVTLRGVVTSFPCELGDGTRFVFEILDVEGGDCSRVSENKRQRVLATMRPGADVRYGDLLRMTGRLSVPSGARNPGGFDYGAYLLTREIHGVFQGRSTQVRLLGANYGHALLARLIGPARRTIGNLIEERTGGDTKAMLRGLLLGDRALVSNEVRESMARAGVIHVMAVSGLHVGMVALIAAWIARFAGYGPGVSSGATAAGVLVYCAIVGFPASACRACTMVICYLLCRRLQRAGAAFGSLTLAAFVLLIWRPAWILTPGFQLSFAAAAGVLASMGRLRRVTRRMRSARSWPLAYVPALSAASIGASAATWPLLLYHFGRTPLLFLAGNLFAVPLVGITLAWGLSGVAAGFVSADISALLLASCWAVGRVLLWGCDLVASIPWSSASAGPVSPIPIYAYFLCFYLVLVMRRSKRLAAAGCLLVSSALILAGPRFRAERKMLEAAFLDVGHGDACVFLVPDGGTMLVDAGAATRNWNAGRDVVLPFLRARGVVALDRVLISHGDGDHWGGLEAVADEIQIGELVLPADTPLGDLGDVVSTLVERGTPVRWATAGDTLPPLGRLDCVVMHPSEEFDRRYRAQLGEELNDRSVVLKATYGNAGFLLAGDVEGAAENWLVAHATGLRCSVLKVPHHGSDTSSSLNLLHLVSPALAVISCGPRHRFNLPKPEILARYDSLGVSTMVTAVAGAVIVTTDGYKLHARSHLKRDREVDIDL